MQVAVTADGDPGKTPLSGYFPEIAFGEMFGELEYSFPFDLITLDDLGGSGVPQGQAVPASISRFPRMGRTRLLPKFKALCAALPPTRRLGADRAVGAALPHRQVVGGRQRPAGIGSTGSRTETIVPGPRANECASHRRGVRPATR